jgi:integrase
MGYSINLYLDRAISEKSLKEINNSKNKDLIKVTEDTFENKKLQIFLYLRFSGRTVKVYLDRKVTQKQWDTKGQEVNPRFYKDGAIDLNNYLAEIKSLTGKLFEKNTAEKIITTREQIKEVVDFAGNKDMLSTASITFEKAFEEFIDVNKKIKSSGTISTYETTLKHLREFSKEKKVKLIFENINKEFERKFGDYLFDDLNMYNNSVGKYIKNLITFMNYSTNEKTYNSPSNNDYKKFIKWENDKEVYALSKQQLLELYNFDLKNPSHAHTRDTFVFMAATNLRISDVRALRHEHIHWDEGYIRILVQKTRGKEKQARKIPFNFLSKAILEKYKNSDTPLYNMSEQNTNFYLHEIARDHLKWNFKVREVKFKRNVPFETFVPFHEVFTCHVGRKTWITLSYLMGMQESDSISMGSPKKEKDRKKYIAFVNERNTDVMNTIWSEENISKK